MSEGTTIHAPAPLLTDYRIVIDSIGDSGVHLITSLRHISKASEQELARMVFRAPSELVHGLDEGTARRMADLLRDTGAEVRVLRADEAFDPGDGDHEIALVVRDPGRMKEVVGQLVEVLGVNARQAVRLVCQSPAVLVGGVSGRTAETLARRFERLGTELDVTRTQDALYDLFLGPCPVSIRELARRRVREAGVEPLPDQDEAGRLQPLLAAGLPHDRVRDIWESSQRTSIPLRVLNRDFQRFDIRLDAAEPTAAMRTYLERSTGIPAEAVEQVLDALPVVLHRKVPFRQVEDELQAAAQAGGSASAHLLSFQTFDLEVADPGPARSVARTLAVIAGRSAAEIEGALDGAPSRLEGPFTQSQAEWLVWEMRQAGTDVAMRLR